jgi:uncharacterized protein (DUF305 family)
MLQTKNFLKYNNRNMGNPCGKYINDDQFLKHMIPHHQVAVDMSKEVLKHTTDPSIVYLARNIIFKQTDEILFMENVLLSFIPNMASKDKQHYQKIDNQFTIWYPKESRADVYQCGLHHFSSKVAKMHKLKKGELFTDENFMKGMINHHDVAIEMSERMVKNSQNPTIMTFANEIIKAQRYEIFLMKNYLKYSQKQCSPMFTIPINNLVPLKLKYQKECSPQTYISAPIYTQIKQTDKIIEEFSDNHIFKILTITIIIAFFIILHWKLMN